MFAAATNIYWLFIGRIIDGIAAGNFPIAQSYLVDIAKTDKERTTNLGLIGAIFGIGLIIGPLLGGALSQISLSLPFWLVGGLAIFNTVLAFFSLPETNQNINKETVLSFNPFKAIVSALTKDNLRAGFIAWFLFGLALAGQQAILALYLESAFNFNPLAISLVLMGMGVILVVNQAVMLKKVWLKYFSEEKLIASFMIILTFGFIILGFSFLVSLAIGLFFLSVSQSILRVVMTSQITKDGDIREQGMILGVLSSVMSLSMIIGPIVAGVLFTQQIYLPFIAGAGFTFLAFIIIFYHKKKRSQKVLISEEELIISEQKIEFTA